MKIDRKVLEQAINKFGNSTQLIVAMEEMSELTKEITKKMRFNDENNLPLIEEMADVYIMLEQLKIMYSITDSELQLFIVKKLDRLGRLVGMLS